MSRKTLNSIPGLSTEIGFYLGGMEEVREQLREAVEGMSSDHIGRPAISDAHAIGALVLHIGEAEWYWLQCVVSGQKVTDQISCAPYWDVLKDPKAFPEKSYSAEFCLNEIKKIREQTHEILATFKDSDLERIFSTERRGETHERSLRWILHHLIDHEAQHKGQILMLKRLMGLKNEGLFS
ncbi:MAG: DinB family protein [Acidobacteriota bacterium]|nr:DinB family protein [Acidobacteriota bacterium]